MITDCPKPVPAIVISVGREMNGSIAARIASLEMENKVVVISSPGYSFINDVTVRKGTSKPMFPAKKHFMYSPSLMTDPTDKRKGNNRKKTKCRRKFKNGK